MYSRIHKYRMVKIYLRLINNNSSCIKLFYLIGFNQGFNLCSFIILSDFKFAFKKDLEENVVVFKQHVHKVHESTRLCTQRPGIASRSAAWLTDWGNQRPGTLEFPQTWSDTDDVGSAQRPLSQFALSAFLPGIPKWAGMSCMAENNCRGRLEQIQNAGPSCFIILCLYCGSRNGRTGQLMMTWLLYLQWK